MTSSVDAVDATGLSEPDTWHTGTVLDEFTPIYLALARATKMHGSISPVDVDPLDITLVAQLMGAGSDTYETVASTDLAEMRRRAAAGEPISWETMGT